MPTQSALHTNTAWAQYTTSSTTSSTNNWIDSNDQYKWIVNDSQRGRQVALSRRQRIIMQQLPAQALLQGPSCNIDASLPVKHMIDEMFDTLTNEGIEQMNNITKQINFLNLNEVDFAGLLKFKDNSLLRIHDDGNYEIMDGFGKAIYKNNNIRSFNRFIEGSTLLEEFIKDCGAVGVRQSEFMSIPIEVFIHWLICKAALKDDDPLPEGVFRPEEHPKTKSMKLPRCLACGKFISPTFVVAGINFCNEKCMLIVQQKKIPVLRLTQQVS